MKSIKLLDGTKVVEGDKVIHIHTGIKVEIVYIEDHRITYELYDLNSLVAEYGEDAEELVGTQCLMPPAEFKNNWYSLNE